VNPDMRAVERAPAGTTCGMAMVLSLLMLAGCASTKHRAPVEERNVSSAPVAAAPVAAVAVAPAASEPVKPLPGAENAGKPGYYTVRPGDTVIRIAIESGQAPRDIARWNTLENPDLIEVGQVLRVVPPAADPTLASARPVTPAKVE